MKVILFGIFSILVTVFSFSQTGKADYLFIDYLQKDDQYQIVRESKGCFHYSFDTLLITNTDKGIFLIYHERKAALKDQNLENYKLFEKALLHTDFTGWCTTENTYYIRTKYEYSLVCIDGSCEWNGFKDLLDSLFWSE